MGNCARLSVVAVALLCGLVQAATVYRCPGDPPVYTDQITAEDAKAKGCRAIERAPSSVIAEDTHGVQCPGKQVQWMSKERADKAVRTGCRIRFTQAELPIDYEKVMSDLEKQADALPDWKAPALGPIDKWRYESCQQDAAKAPTDLGVRRGMRLCDIKFGRLPPCSGYKQSAPGQCHDPN